MRPYSTATPYSFELPGSTQKGVGMTPFVISGKRMAYADYQRTSMASSVDSLAARLAAVEATAHHADVHDDSDEASMGMALGAAGIALGIVSLCLAIAAFVKKPAGGAGGDSMSKL